ncbi:MAG: preprotein translocase subunit SecA, partial [Spirochaetales bacterium]|nr:preprotein translocase subunit SecA [Spirochaetales bacterium]
MSIFTAIFGSKKDKDLKHLTPIVEKVNSYENWAKGLKDEDFPLQTKRFKERLASGETLDQILPEAYALVREASFRVLGERHYDVQIMGAIVLHEGKILELKTGEGKTLTSVPAGYLNALEGKGVHIITVNDYLAQRDASWMGPIYNFLGLTVGVIVANMDNERRRLAYQCDVTYGTNNEFGFDYLRDNMKLRAQDKIQPKHHFCIIDEIDSILIDEARTPLIISGPADDDTELARN